METNDVEKKLKDYEDKMPPEIRGGVYDAMILYSHEDRIAAQKFQQHLIKEIKLRDDGVVRAVLYDGPEMASLAQSKLKHLEEAMDRCTYVFMFLTEKFCNDKWTELSSEACLMRTIEDPQRSWSVVPVYTVSKKNANFKIPMGLNALKGVFYYNDDDCYKNGMKRLFESKMEMREENERRLLQKQIDWFGNYIQEQYEEDGPKTDASALKKLLRTDDKYLSLYEEELRKGTVEMHNLKILVVGQVDTGKTTLIRNLLEEPVTIGQKDKTTGIDLHVHRVEIDLDTKKWTVLKESGQEEDIMRKLKNLMLKAVPPESEGAGHTVNTQGSLAIPADDTPPPSVDLPNFTDLLGGLMEESDGDAPSDRKDTESLSNAPDSTEQSTKNVNHADLKQLCVGLESVSDDPDISSRCAYASILDFAGEKIYYSCHQTFLSPDVVYVLTHRLDQHSDKDALESTRSWLQAIHWYSGCGNTGSPPVLLVGTFKDKLPSQTKAEEDCRKRTDSLWKNLAKDDLIDHLHDGDDISNQKVDDATRDSIRNKIVELAETRGFLKNWGQPVAATWLRLLLKLKDCGKRIISFAEVNQINCEMVPHISSKEGVRLCLKYFHEIGEIMFFDEDGLRDKVIVDMKLYVDALKSLFCEYKDIPRDRTIINLWLSLTDNGVLSEHFLDILWKDELKENKDLLLEFMLRTHVLAELPGSKQGRLFLAPCMLDAGVTEDIRDSVAGTKRISSVLCFVSTKKVLPPAVFHRLIAACTKIQGWRPSTRVNKDKWVYADFAEFKLDNASYLQLFHKRHTIQMRILYFAENREHGLDLKKLFQQIKKTIVGVSCFLNVVQDLGQDLFEVYFKCKDASLDEVDSLIENYELLRGDHIACELCRPTHALEKVDITCDWSDTEEEMPTVWLDPVAVKQEVVVKKCNPESRWIRKQQEDLESVYEMSRSTRGKCVIINNRTFHKRKDDPDDKPPDRTRYGTEHDERGLVALFEQLHFTIEVHRDKTAQEIRNILQEDSKDPMHQDSDCFVCVVMSHGSIWGVYGVDWAEVPVGEIMQYYNADDSHCQGLAGKPKIFFIQACKGIPGRITGAEITEHGDLVSSDFADGRVVNELRPDAAELKLLVDTDADTIPARACVHRKKDMLVASATVDGFDSLRSRSCGTWFIQAVIYVFKRFAHLEHLTDLLLKVNELVSRGQGPVRDNPNQKKRQASEVRHTLVKKLFFFPGISEETKDNQM